MQEGSMTTPPLHATPHLATRHPTIVATPWYPPFHWSVKLHRVSQVGQEACFNVQAQRVLYMPCF